MTRTGARAAIGLCCCMDPARFRIDGGQRPCSSIQRRKRFLGFAAAVLLALLQQAPAAAADERIEGAVLETTLTHCEATKRGGCSGTLTLQGNVGGKIQTLAIKVPLGTPISRGCETVPLHGLKGKTVIITEVIESSARVARAIEVLEKADSAC